MKVMMNPATRSVSVMHWFSGLCCFVRALFNWSDSAGVGGTVSGFANTGMEKESVNAKSATIMFVRVIVLRIFASLFVLFFMGFYFAGGAAGVAAGGGVVAVLLTLCVTNNDCTNITTTYDKNVISRP